MNAFPELQLMIAILRDVPRLGDQRACLNVAPALMDATTFDDAQAAMAVCGGCKVKQACKTWAMSPNNKGKLEGVVAGQLRGSARMKFYSEIERTP